MERMVYKVAESTLFNEFDDGAIISVDDNFIMMDVVGKKMWETIVKCSEARKALEILMQYFDCDEKQLKQDLENFLEQMVSFGALYVETCSS